MVNYKLGIPYNEFLIGQKGKLVFKPIILQVNRKATDFENHKRNEEKTLTNIFLGTGIANFILVYFVLFKGI